MEGGRTDGKPGEQGDKEAGTTPAVEAATALSWKMRISFSRNTKLCAMLKNSPCSQPSRTPWVNFHTNSWQTENWRRKPVATGDIGANK